MTLKKFIMEYAKLSSAHFVFLTAIIPVTGAIAMGEKNLFSLTIIFIIGLIAHVFGFAFNQYNDIEVDRLVNTSSQRPLPSGTISKKHAIIYIIIVFLLGLFITFYFFGMQLVAIYLVGIFLASIYDIFSKKISGMDFILAASVSIGVLFGAATVSFGFSSLVIILTILAFLQTLNLNLIVGGIKDADHDVLIDSKHIATRLGVTVDNNVLLIPNSFKILAYLFGFIYAFVVLIPVLFRIINLHVSFFIVLFLINFIFLFVIDKLVSLKKFNRHEMRKYVAINYNINWLNIPILLMSIRPWAGLLLLYPILGLIISNILLYRTIIRPQIW
jgi:4-hydroxybenzoate polyprenyltransferase